MDVAPGAGTDVQREEIPDGLAHPLHRGEDVAGALYLVGARRIRPALVQVPPAGLRQRAHFDSVEPIVITRKSTIHWTPNRGLPELAN